MDQQQADSIIHRWLITGGVKKPPRVEAAYRFRQRKHQAKTPTVNIAQLKQAIKSHEQVLARGEGYKKRAGVRDAIANYLEQTVIPSVFAEELFNVAAKLRKARRTFTWGTRPDGEIMMVWDDKSGLVRLDPDEAREETRRLAERYIPALMAFARAGYGLHYCVFTMPNFAPDKLALGKKKLYKRFVNLLRKRLNKAPMFPELMGALVVQEDPLSADGTWNVHLNVVLVTKETFHPGLYKKLRRAWHWNVELKPLKAGAGDLARTFNELIKYSTQAVPEKAADKASRGATRAPAMTEWSAAQFWEWWQAQKGFRRTRTYGCLYGNKVLKPEPLGLDDVTWHGTGYCGKWSFSAQAPLLIDLIPGDKSTTDNRLYPDNLHTGPPR